jgi:hypothetical protein
MSFFGHPFQVVFFIFAEWVRREQEKVIDYLHAEAKVLREQLGDKRILLTDDARRLLAVKGMALEKEDLERACVIVQPDTVRRWHRDLVEANRYESEKRKTGRPRTDQEIVDFVLRMARENTSWGYKRIEGALHNLGYAICSSSVANILKQHGIEPAPSRKRTTSWSTFLKTHWDVFEGLDLGAITLWLGELMSYVLGSISHSRAIPCPEVVVSNDLTPYPTTHTIRIHIFQVPETVNQPARAPPIPAGVPASISPCEIRHAA